MEKSLARFLKKNYISLGSILLLAMLITPILTLIITTLTDSRQVLLYSIAPDGKSTYQAVNGLTNFEVGKSQVLTGDFDGNKQKDILVTGKDMTYLYSLVDYDAKITHKLSNTISEYAQAYDFDGNGQTDLVDYMDGKLSVSRYSSSDQNFSVCVSLDVAADTFDKIATNDFNGDKLVDLMLFKNDDNEEAIYLASKTADNCGVDYVRQDSTIVLKGENAMFVSGEYDGNDLADLAVIFSNQEGLIIRGGIDQRDATDILTDKDADGRPNTLYETMPLPINQRYTSVVGYNSSLLYYDHNTKDQMLYIRSVDEFKPLKTTMTRNSQVHVWSNADTSSDPLTRTWEYLLVPEDSSDLEGVNATTGAGPSVSLGQFTASGGKYSYQNRSTSISSFSQAGQKYFKGDFDGNSLDDVMAYGPGALNDMVYLASRPMGSQLSAGVMRRVPVGKNNETLIGTITATQSNATGFIVVYNCSAPQPSTSSINFVAGQTIASTIMVTSSADGFICLTSNVAVHAIWDTIATLPSTSLPLQAPRRRIDTRDSVNSLIKTKLVANTVTEVTLGSANSTIIGTMTTVDSAALGYISIFPCVNDQGVKNPTPTISSMTIIPSNVLTVMSFVKLDRNGKACIYTNQGTHFIFDQLSETTSISSGLAVRRIDTRLTSGTLISGMLKPNVEVSASLATGSSMVAGTITVTGGASDGFVVAYPCRGDGSNPAISSINFTKGQTISNALVSGTSNGLVCFKANVGVHIIIDVTTNANFSLSQPARIYDSRNVPGTGVVGFNSKYIAGVANSVNDTNLIPIAGNFNGDVKDEIFWYSPGSGVEYLWIFDSTKNDFVSCQANDSVNESYYKPIAGDFNGDGYDDILWYADSPNDSYIWYMTAATGCGAVKSLAVKVPNKLPVNNSVQVDDYNQDGNADILWQDTTSGKVVAWWGNKVPDGNYHVSFITDYQANGNFKSTGVDVNLDGYPDVFWYLPSAQTVNPWNGTSGGLNGFMTATMPINGSVLGGKFAVNEGQYPTSALLFIAETDANLLHFVQKPKGLYTPTSGKYDISEPMNLCNSTKKAETGYSGGVAYPITVCTIGRSSWGGFDVVVNVGIAEKVATGIVAAKESGVNLMDEVSGANSSFRSMAVQTSLYNQLGPGLAAAPGYSNHQMGNAIDFGASGGGACPTIIGGKCANTNSPAWNWLSKNTSIHQLIQYSGEYWHWSINGS